MRKILVILLLFLCSFTFFVPAQSLRDSEISAENTKWVSDSLREIKTIEIGHTRADLLKIFDEEGGLSTGLKRTYVYHKCLYMKVDVEFKPVGRPEKDEQGRVTLEESGKDTIKSISKPYLEWSIND